MTTAKAAQKWQHLRARAQCNTGKIAATAAKAAQKWRHFARESAM